MRLKSNSHEEGDGKGPGIRRARGQTVSKLEKCLCGTRYTLRCTGVKFVCRMFVQAYNFSQSDNVNPMYEIFKP